MERNEVDLELFDLLMRFVLLSQQLRDGTMDAGEARMERMDLATQLRQRGFLISDPQIQSLDGRLMH